MTTLIIPDMNCSHCQATVEKTVRRLDPTASMAFDLPAHRLTLASAADTDAIKVALSAEGYPVAS